MLRSDDSQVYEEGYHWLVGDVDSGRLLLPLMKSEPDPVIRDRMIEVIASSDDSELIKQIVSELSSEHEEVRMWAYSAIVNSGSIEYKGVVDRFVASHPDETYL